MSAEDRQAKAARAKKLLADRKKKKNAAATPSTSTPAPSSPAVSEAASGRPSLDEAKRSAEETNSEPLDGPEDTGAAKANGVRGEQETSASVKDEEEVETITESTKKEVPEIIAVPPKGSADEASTNIVTSPASADSLANLQQTVSLLIAERTDLQNQVASLQTSLNAAKGDSQLLVEGRALTSRLEEEKKAVEEKLEAESQKAARVAGLEEDVAGLQKQVDEARVARDSLRTELDNSAKDGEKREKQTKSKLDEAEKSLDRAREREGGLEAELGRLRQGNTDLQSKLDKSAKELEDARTSSENEGSSLADLKKKHDDLESSHSKLKEEHAALQNTHEGLTTDHDKLKSEHDSSSASRSDNEKQLADSRKEVDEIKAKNESAAKKAEGVEKKRAALQEENAELVKQLEEVRGRVVEVMEEKLGLAAAVESWETKSKGWEKEKGDLSAASGDVQSLRDQLSSLAEENRRLEETSTAHADLLRDHESGQNRLANASRDLEAAEERIRKLEAAQTSISNAETANGDDDAVSSLQAQHALDISTQMEKIRALETSLHESTSRVHTLTRQLADLQSAYVAAQRDRDEALLNGTLSPRGNGAKGLFISSDDDGKLSPLGHGHPSRPSGVDALLPASVRHKRQVSLSALKARMEPSYSRPPLSPMHSVNEADEGSRRQSISSNSVATPGKEAGRGTKSKTQFGDEIVFCCPACDGDLITL